MFVIQQERNEWRIVANYGNPFFEPGEVLEVGYETREEAEADVAKYMRENGLTTAGTD